MLAQGLSCHEFALEMSGRAAVIWRLDWGWPSIPKVGNSPGSWPEAPSPLCGLGFSTMWWLASPRVNDQEAETEAAISSRTSPWRSHMVTSTQPYWLPSQFYSASRRELHQSMTTRRWDSRRAIWGLTTTYGGNTHHKKSLSKSSPITLLGLPLVAQL